MIYRTRDIADQFRVTQRTVRYWMAKGYLKPRGYRLIKSCAIQAVFTNVEIDQFMDKFLIKPEDLAPGVPWSLDARIAQAQRINATNRRNAAQGSAVMVAKRKARKIAAETPSPLPLDLPPKPKE